MVEGGSVTLGCAQTLTGHSDRVWSVVWYHIIKNLFLITRNPQGDLLASCSSDKTIKIWGKREDGYLECQVE